MAEIARDKHGDVNTPRHGLLSREFQNDALIALTARHHAATIVTANRSDFELLRAELGVSLLLVR